MNIEFEKIGENVIVKMPVEFEIEEAGEFRDALSEMIKSGKKDFVLDFSKCNFIDSTGLGVIVSIYKKCVEKGGSVKVKALNNQVLKIFRLTRLDKVFEISV